MKERAMVSRRRFVQASAAAIALSALPSLAKKKGKPMRILVLGGTGFLGPHFVEAALKNGHQLTLFNRGKTNPGRFKDDRYNSIEQLQGDRKTDLTALNGKQWDAVLDTSAYLPSDVKRSCELLKDAVNQYLLISTVSVYAKNNIPNLDESGELIELPAGTEEKVTNETYGGFKAASEKMAQSVMPNKACIVRPGLIVGPGDTTDRFTYWPARALRGGEILAPEKPEAPTQFIDVRDLAEFILRLIENKNVDVYNADAQAGSLTMGALINSCIKQAKNKAKPVWVPADFLEAQKVGAWMDLPCWIPAAGEYAGFGRTSAAKAKKAGLRYRPLDITVRDTMKWWQEQSEERRAKPKAGLSAEREAAVLKAWKERKT
jgi:2'-hydroxyisoflavone reductase